MTIIVHHLGISQGERILWLCEELGLPYEIVKHTRSPLGAPDSLKAVTGNATGKSPFIEDTDAKIGLAESAAICEYLIHTYGEGRLAIKPGDKQYPDYLYWFHFANGTQIPTMQDWMFLSLVEGDNIAKQIADQRVHAMLKVADERLKNSRWFAGPDFTAADIMSMYGFSTQRYWGPQWSYEKYPNIVRWMGDCAVREAYRKAMAKGDPEMALLTGVEGPKIGMFAAGGTASDHWKQGKGNL